MQLTYNQIFNFATIYGEYVVISGMIGSRNAIGGA